MTYTPFSIAVDLLVKSAYPKTGEKKNLQMSGDPHYQPEDLKPYLGYDQRVSWQILVAWYWLVALAKAGKMTVACKRLLTKNLLNKMLINITTTKVRNLERSKTSHDILALLELMREYLPKELHKYLHLCLTSYDIINTAYAIQNQQTFRVFHKKAMEVDFIWCKHIAEQADTLQIGRTHLQDALPITAGFGLAITHHRFVDSTQEAGYMAYEIPGKFSGAVGTKAALTVLFSDYDLEDKALKLLGLPSSVISKQIIPPENTQRFFHELTMISASLAQLGEDIRHLQSSAIGEITSASSTSSTMSHKGANPIAAENISGMYRSVLGEMTKVMLNANSDLGRDLRDSNVMRGYNAIFVFVYQQLLTTHRLLKSFKVDENRCLQNFSINGKLVTAELLHLSLQLAGYTDAHTFINKVIVPQARKNHLNLADMMKRYIVLSEDEELKIAWSKIPSKVLYILENPDKYIGDAEKMAIAESKNTLKEKPTFLEK